MDAKELAKKEPMAMPGFTVITPQRETEYDKKIQEEQEKRMADCCGSGSSRQNYYAHYGYQPRPKNPTTDSPPAPESKNTPPTDRKNSKR